MTTKSKAIEQLDRYIRSRYPLIVVVSHEERQVINTIKTLAGPRTGPNNWRPRKIAEWSITTGLVGLEDFISPDETKNSPIAALGALCEYPTGDDVQPVIVVLKDMHHYMDNAVVVRSLRDLTERFSQSKHTAILISPSFQVPGDLEKSMAMIDWPLPDQGELSEILSRIERDLAAKGVKVTLNGGRERVIQALQGLTIQEATCVVNGAVVATKELGEGVIPHIVSEKRQIIRKSGVLEFYDTDVTMNQVGGLENLKRYAQIKRATFSSKARSAGVEPARGVLLVGVPGTGKSLSAKAIAGGQMPLLRMDIGALMGSLVGQSEANMRSALRIAEAVSPCVLWCDEIEKALGGASGEMDGGTSMRVFGTLLTWMQETTAQVYVVATANDVRSLRPELLRRFDDIFWVDLPGKEDRKQVLTVHLEKRSKNPASFDLDTLADVTQGYTGAELEKIVKAGLEAAFFDGSELTTDHLIAEARQIVPISKTMKAKIDELRSWASGRARLASQPYSETHAGGSAAGIEL